MLVNLIIKIGINQYKMTMPQFKKSNFEIYHPGKSYLKKNKNIVKLSANESALGVSPKVKKAIKQKINFSRYPDGKSENLKFAISKNLNVILKKLFVDLDQMRLYKLFVNYF